MRHIIILLLLPVLVSAQKVHTFNGKHLTQKDRIELLEARIENQQKVTDFIRGYYAYQLHELVTDQNMLTLRLDSLFMIIQKQDTITDLLMNRMDVRDQLDRLNSLRYNPPLPEGWIEMQPGIRLQWDTVNSIKLEPDRDGNILISPTTTPMISAGMIQALLMDSCKGYTPPPAKRHKKRKKKPTNDYGLYRGLAPYRVDRLLRRYVI